MRKKNRWTPKNTPQNTNDHTYAYLRCVSLPICLRWSAVWFWGVIRKHRKSTCNGLSLCLKLYKKGSFTQLISCNLCKTFKNNYFVKHLRTDLFFTCDKRYGRILFKRHFIKRHVLFLFWTVFLECSLKSDS